MEVKAKVIALISPHSSIKPQDLSNPQAVHNLMFFRDAPHEYWIKEGYTYAGTAEITFTPVEAKDLIANKIEALRGEVSKIRAEAKAKATKIEGQIQNLLAIGFDEATIVNEDPDEIPF